MWVHCASFLTGSGILVAKPLLLPWLHSSLSLQYLSSTAREGEEQQQPRGLGVTTAGWQQLMFLFVLILFWEAVALLVGAGSCGSRSDHFLIFPSSRSSKP